MIGIELTPEHHLDRVVELGTAAEQVGFDTVFTSCHYNNRDPFVVLTRLARETSAIRLGPGVMNPYEIHPVRLASTMGTLSEASDGRTVLGIGAGDRSTLRNLGLADQRGLRSVLETIKVTQRLWAGERIDHEGTFRARDAQLNYTAGESPVYVGGEGPHMCRMAAKHADGLLFNGSHPDDVAWAREQVEHGLDDRPADRGAFDFAAYTSVSIARDADAAREAARPPVAFITAGASESVLDRHGIDAERAATIGESISEGAFSTAFEAVTESMIEAFCVAGTPETVTRRLDAVFEHADSVVVSAPLGPDLDTAIELAKTAVDQADR
ncbi:5,10-methylenetetrahydromethanopterin reductase [Halocatena pleomorpha]|uniref:5,10-methylenetetrahydromethanopterin reductase n=1 Tax=Halocatena pleomorpha TaxID=1785090 RepID=A0A3P3R5A4_9EURY|nr:5,10-methylenetetrahydromethanopterin reductase [Halocatena pleomorpha]RRJ28636.1 5,10-methylenetetrahydromethanopterin reductase [Halocatena pleomorpha]